MQLVIFCQLFCLPLAPYETRRILTTYHIGPIGNARILKELVKPSLRKCEWRNTLKCVFFRLEINISMLRRWLGVEADTRVDTSMFPGRVGVAPNCSVGLGEEGQKVGKGQLPVLPLLCTRNFPPCQGSPVIFPVQDTQLFCNASLYFHSYLIQFSVWSPKIKWFNFHSSVLRQLKGDLNSGCLSLAEKAKQGDMLTMHL